MGHGYRYGAFPVKGQAAGYHLKHGNPQGINITSGIYSLAPGLFRRNIVDRPHGTQFLGIGRCCTGNTEIRHFHLAVLGHNNVLGLDIPMDNIMLMGSRHSLSHLNGDSDGLFCFQTPFLGNIAFQSDSLDQLHDDIMNIAFIHNIKYIDNIGMGQPGSRLGFQFKTINKTFIAAEFVLQHLNSHQTV